MGSFFALKRLRISKGLTVAYDEEFHRGVNIIRGENSSGKSTIADFIFYALGGEFDRWKDAASKCDVVYLELETAESILTLRRNIGEKQEPALVYYGRLEEALGKGIDAWERFPIRRPSGGKELSYSQVLFRAAGIPEARNANNSNITMHQILRLLYADQQTPAGKLFRFESFDTRDIREAVGQLIIGINGYELYEAQIKVRELKAQYAEKDRLYEAALLGVPSAEGLTSVAGLDRRISEINQTKEAIYKELESVDNLIGEGQIDEFLEGRRKAQIELRRLSGQLIYNERKIIDLKDEIVEIEEFLNYLSE